MYFIPGLSTTPSAFLNKLSLNLYTPVISIMSSGVIFPGLKIVGIPSITFTTVDSSPTLVSPPSIIISTLF